MNGIDINASLSYIRSEGTPMPTCTLPGRLDPFHPDFTGVIRRRGEGIRPDGGLGLQ
jgi:hypothetical protein